MLTAVHSLLLTKYQQSKEQYSFMKQYSCTPIHDENTDTFIMKWLPVTIATTVVRLITQKKRVKGGK